MVFHVTRACSMRPLASYGDRQMRLCVIILAGASLLVLSSCGLVGDGSITVTTGDGVVTTTAAPDTTSAPDTTAAPGTTDVPETTLPPEIEDGESVAPWWLLVVVGAGFLILLVAFVARGSKKKIEVAPPPRTWKDSARSGYAAARWLYDAMSEDLAIWRGNATFDATTAVGATASTALATTWENLDARLSTASDNLYSLEAAAPDQKTSLAANETITAMRSVRSAVDARAEARMNYRTVEAQSGDDQTALRDAREREVRAARNLAETRSAYGRALTNLSTNV